MTKVDVPMRITGSILVITAYFVVLHINMTLGVMLHFVADMISVPYFIRTKSWDVVIMLMFLLAISFSKLLTLTFSSQMNVQSSLHRFFLTSTSSRCP
jgi:hypothetical protein